jgi:hypothetical protein
MEFSHVLVTHWRQELQRGIEHVVKDGSGERCDVKCMAASFAHAVHKSQQMELWLANWQPQLRCAL